MDSVAVSVSHQNEDDIKILNLLLSNERKTIQNLHAELRRRGYTGDLDIFRFKPKEEIEDSSNRKRRSRRRRESNQSRDSGNVV